MNLFETLGHALKPETMVLEFKVISVSENTNSFGLKQMVMVGRKGEAYKGCFNYLNVKKRGEIIHGIVTLNDDAEIKCVEFTGVELVQRIEDAPEDVLKEIWK
jgi:hypothetical protein